MKKSLALLVITPVVLSACFLDRFTTPKTPTPTVPPTDTVSDNSGSKVETPVTTPVVMKDVVSKGDTVAVDYVGTLEDGTVFDSSLEESAKKTKSYTPGARVYEPLKFTVGAGQMIAGFDAGVVGMKLGEKKTLTIAPEDAYGAAFKEQEVPAKYFQDTFSETVSLDNFKDTVTQVVPMSALGEKGT